MKKKNDDVYDTYDGENDESAGAGDDMEESWDEDLDEDEEEESSEE